MSEKPGDPPLTAALLVDTPRAAAPVISPDGHWVAWTASAPGGPGEKTGSLWLASAGPDAVPVRLASGEVRMPCWSADSRWLYYVAAGPR